MKDEYLWNKVGEDSEIERIEDAMLAFRYQVGPPPDLPSKTAIERGTGWKLSFAFAFATCVVAVVYAGIWFSEQENTNLIGSDRGAIEETAVLAVPRDEVHRAVINSPAEEPTTGNVDRHPAKIVLRRINKVRQPPGVFSKTMASKGHLPVLTNEEKYAYRQLMLALSITGSQLKIVTETINGNEDNDSYTNKR